MTRKTPKRLTHASVLRALRRGRACAEARFWFHRQHGSLRSIWIRLCNTQTEESASMRCWVQWALHLHKPGVKSSKVCSSPHASYAAIARAARAYGWWR